MTSSLSKTWEDVEEECVTYYVGATLRLHLNFSVGERFEREDSAIQVQSPNGYICDEYYNDSDCENVTVEND